MQLFTCNVSCSFLSFPNEKRIECALWMDGSRCVCGHWSQNSDSNCPQTKHIYVEIMHWSERMSLLNSFRTAAQRKFRVAFHVHTQCYKKIIKCTHNSNRFMDWTKHSVNCGRSVYCKLSFSSIQFNWKWINSKLRRKIAFGVILLLLSHRTVLCELSFSLLLDDMRVRHEYGVHTRTSTLVALIHILHCTKRCYRLLSS